MTQRWYEQLTSEEHARIERFLADNDDSNGAITLHHKGGVILAIEQGGKWRTANGQGRKLRSPRTSSVPTRV